jgi:hypothetical protein
MNLHALFNHFPLAPLLPYKKDNLPSKGFIKASLVTAAHAPAEANISKLFMDPKIPGKNI